MLFESSVNLYGRKTPFSQMLFPIQFESSVNLYGRKTKENSSVYKEEFESSVNLYGRKTDVVKHWTATSLRVV